MDEDSKAHPLEEGAPKPRGLDDLTRWVREEVSGLFDRRELKRRVLAEGSRLLPDFYFRRFRTQLYRWAGCEIAFGSSLMGELSITGPEDAAERLHIGPGTTIGPGVKFDLEAEITLGKNVAIGPHCIFATSSHALGHGSRRMSHNKLARPIVIDDGVWVGIGCIVLPGVRIGHGAVISAGSVVTRSVEPNTLMAGNPATVVKTLPLGDR